MSLGTVIYLAAMAAIYVAQRLLPGHDGLQGGLTGVALVGLATAALLRFRRLRAVRDDGLRLGHRLALMFLLVGCGSLVMYAATTDGVVRGLTLAQEAEDRWLGVWRSLWPVVWLLGTVPLLVDGKTRMTESAAIVHYLAMVHAGGRLTLAPGHPDYGAYLNWLHHGEATLTFPQTIVLRYALLEPQERRQPAVADDYRRWFLGRLRLAEAALADGRDHLAGATFTMADISVGYAIMLALRLGMEADLPPGTLAWFRRLAQRPGFLAAKAAQEKAAA